MKPLPLTVLIAGLCFFQSLPTSAATTNINTEAGDYREVSTDEVGGDTYRFSGKIRQYSESLLSLGVHYTGGTELDCNTRFSISDIRAAPVIGVRGNGTTVRYTGRWIANGGQSKSSLVLQDGGRMIIEAAADLDFILSNSLFTRQLWVFGDGTGTLEFAEGFVADHTDNGVTADGIASVRLSNAHFVTHHTQSLPVAPRPDGEGGLQINGHFVFENEPGSSWTTRTNPQEYTGMVIFEVDGEVITETDLTHSGVAQYSGHMGSYWAPNAFQTGEDNLTVTKSGPADLILAGEAGFYPGSLLRIEDGGIVFQTDPLDGGLYPNAIPASSPHLTIEVSPGKEVVFDHETIHLFSLDVQPGARLVLEAQPDGRFPQVSVEGLMQIANATLVLRNSGQHSVALNQEQVLASGGLEGIFSSIRDETGSELTAFYVDNHISLLPDHPEPTPQFFYYQGDGRFISLSMGDAGTPSSQEPLTGWSILGPEAISTTDNPGGGANWNQSYSGGAETWTDPTGTGAYGRFLLAQYPSGLSESDFTSVSYTFASGNTGIAPVSVIRRGVVIDEDWSDGQLDAESGWQIVGNASLRTSNRTSPANALMRQLTSGAGWAVAYYESGPFGTGPEDVLVLKMTTFADVAFSSAELCKPEIACLHTNEDHPYFHDNAAEISRHYYTRGDGFSQVRPSVDNVENSLYGLHHAGGSTPATLENAETTLGIYRPVGVSTEVEVFGERTSTSTTINRELKEDDFIQISMPYRYDPNKNPVHRAGTDSTNSFIGMSYAHVGVTHRTDVNLDYRTDALDFIHLNSYFGQSGTHLQKGDIDNDGSTTNTDLVLWQTAAGQSHDVGQTDPVAVIGLDDLPGSGTAPTLIYEEATGRLTLQPADAVCALLLEMPASPSIVDRLSDNGSWWHQTSGGTSQWVDVDRTGATGIIELALLPPGLDPADFGPVAYGLADGTGGWTTVAFDTDATRPFAAFSIDREHNPDPLAIRFDASASYDNVGFIVDYAWDYGDGATGTGVITDHLYAVEGDYTVTLTVTDDEGVSDTTTQVIFAGNKAPVISLSTTTTTGYAPLTVQFDASASADPDGTIVSYDWTFGDGSSDTGSAVEHTFTTVGSFTVNLVVTDNLGKTDTSDIAISVTNPPLGQPGAVLFDGTEFLGSGPFVFNGTIHPAHGNQTASLHTARLDFDGDIAISGAYGTAKYQAEILSGGQWHFGANARVNNNKQDLINARLVRFTGSESHLTEGFTNVLSFDAGFSADLASFSGSNITRNGGLSTLHVNYLKLTTNHERNLPTIHKYTGSGQSTHHGLVIVESPIEWLVQSNHQQYDGGIYWKSDWILETQDNLEFTGIYHTGVNIGFGTMAGAENLTLTKRGPASLILNGTQYYASGTRFVIEEGTVRFNTDPGNVPDLANGYSVGSGIHLQAEVGPNGSVEFTVPQTGFDMLGTVPGISESELAGNLIQYFPYGVRPTEWVPGQFSIQSLALAGGSASAGPGQLNIAESLTANPGSTLKLEILPAHRGGALARIEVNSIVDLSGTTLVIKSSEDLQFGTYRLIQSQGLTGTLPALELPVGYLGNLSVDSTDPGLLLLTVTGFDPSVPVATIHVIDGEGEETNGNTLTFLLSVSTALPTPFPMQLSISGMAGFEDFTASPPIVDGVLEFPAGETSLSLVLSPVADGLSEPNETFTLSLENTDFYRKGIQSSADGIILGLPDINVQADGTSFERPVIHSAVSFTRNPARTTNQQVVSFSLSGTATLGSDFQFHGYASFNELTREGQVIMPQGEDTVSLTIAPIDDALLEGPETVTLSILPESNYAIGTSGSASVQIEDDEQPDYGVEQFGEANAFDLLGKRLVYVPNGAGTAYTAHVEPFSGFDYDIQGSGYALPLNDNTITSAPLNYWYPGTTFPFYGVDYDSIWINANGYVCFGSVDYEREESIETHFTQKRIALFWDDLNPESGANMSHWQVINNRFILQFTNVPDKNGNPPNTFQLEIFADGTIRLSYLAGSFAEGLVGISSGTMPVGFAESDLNQLPPPPQPVESYVVWAARHFSPQESLALMDLPEADPDFDGIRNVFEYHYNQNPKSPDRESSSLRPVIRQYSETNTYLILRHRQNPQSSADVRLQTMRPENGPGFLEETPEAHLYHGLDTDGTPLYEYWIPLHPSRSLQTRILADPQ